MTRLPLAAIVAALTLCATAGLAQSSTTGTNTTPTVSSPSVTTETPLSPEAAGLGIGIIIAIVVAGLFFGFIPFGIAVLRGHGSAFAIFLVCLFFGWSGIGWLIALIWSFSDTGRHR